MTGSDILVNALHDEHKDREWVDTYGHHWAWCENMWMRRYNPEKASQLPNAPGYENYHQWEKPASPELLTEPPKGFNYGPGPFMEAVHHRAVYGKQWEHGY